MTMKTRTARVVALLVIAMVNLFGLMSSGRFDEVRTVDALRLLLSGLLIGLAVGQARLDRTVGAKQA